MSDQRSSIRLVPLGGLGEVGMNCLAIEQEGAVMVVDCGMAFPFDDHGVDVIHPDFSWLLERSDDVAGIFLTHGHEDHIGGLPYLLRDLDVPVWGPPHALGLVERRLAEHDFAPDDVPLRVAEPGAVTTVGPFEVEPVRVSHSIVEASALAVRTQAGLVVHSGDFKFDPSPPDGEPTDEARLEALGDEGVALLLSDSTNVDVVGPSASEREVGRALEQLVLEADGLIVLAMFASNIQRLIMLGEIAAKADRRICLLGRSLITQHRVATDIGRLHWPSSLLVDPERAADLPRGSVLVLAGGTQGEPQSSFRRLALGRHTAVELDAGDTVIMSSRIIPGNERQVHEMMSELLRRGVRLHTRVTDPGVHTSGHANRAEQTKMIELVRPDAFMPLHGTFHHLTRHAELAASLGIDERIVTENGTAVRFDGRRLSRDGVVPHGRVQVALGGESLEPEEHERRIELGRAGVAVVSLVIEDGRIVSGPVVTTRGVPTVDDDAAALREVAGDVARAVGRFAGRRHRHLDLTEELRRAARRRLERLSGTRPTVEVHVLGDG